MEVQTLDRETGNKAKVVRTRDDWNSCPLNSWVLPVNTTEPEFLIEKGTRSFRTIKRHQKGFILERSYHEKKENLAIIEMCYETGGKFP